MLPFENPLLMLVVVLTAIVGVGRLARIITYDEFPPSAWVRGAWVKITNGGPWSRLFLCYWCLTPWIMAVCIAWAWFSSLHWSWWVFWGWLALSYLSSILVARDEPPEK